MKKYIVGMILKNQYYDPFLPKLSVNSTQSPSTSFQVSLNKNKILWFGNLNENAKALGGHHLFQRDDESCMINI